MKCRQTCSPEESKPLVIHTNVLALIVSYWMTCHEIHSVFYVCLTCMQDKTLIYSEHKVTLVLLQILFLWVTLKCLDYHKFKV